MIEVATKKLGFVPVAEKISALNPHQTFKPVDSGKPAAINNPLANILVS